MSRVRATSGPPAASEYRFAQGLLVKSLGALLAVVGIAIFVTAMLVVVISLPGIVLTVVVVLGLAAVVAAAVVLNRFGTIVRFDAEGYQVRLLRGAGVRAARWSEVEDSVAATLRGQDCVVLRLRDGRTTTVPVSVLDATAHEFVDDLRGWLNRGRGYRRLR